MLFNSTSFVLFFVAVLILHQCLPKNRRWVLLLLASYAFYMCWHVQYALLIGGSTLVNYGIGLRLHGTHSPRGRRGWLLLGVALNLGVLGVFKYLGLFQDVLSWISGREGAPRVFELLLPVGISFFTFQNLGYLVEVYRQKIEPERHLGFFALYVAFFPQLVAGPIERPQHLLPQLRVPKEVDYERLVSGLRQILWGFFKKLVIADRVGLSVDAIYSTHVDHGALTLIAGTMLFAVQIYCDFSGYSDIAIGTARLLGVDLMENFRRPYLATSLSDFWRRWHISLSTWFRDYVYFPLGGNRAGRGRWFLNLLIVFVLSGLWHGASITFAVWGAIHGLGLVLAVATRTLRGKAATALGFSRFPKLCSLANWACVFVVVNLSWVFFRADSVTDALAILGSIFTLQPGELYVGDRGGFACSLVAIAVLILGEFRGEFFAGKKWSLFENSHAPVRMGAYVMTVLAILLFGVFDGGQFIYFQF